MVSEESASVVARTVSCVGKESGMKACTIDVGGELTSLPGPLPEMQILRH